MSPKALHHQETVNTASQCHKTGFFLGLGSCLHILSTGKSKLCCTVYLSHPEHSDTQRKLSWGDKMQFKKTHFLKAHGTSQLKAGMGTMFVLCCVCACVSKWLEGPVLSVSHKPGVMCTHQYCLHTDIFSSSNMITLLVCHLATMIFI